MGVDIRDYAKLWPFLKVLPFLMFSFLIINFLTSVIFLLSTIVLPFAEI